MQYEGTVWIDPDKSEPAGTHYRLFSTPSRGPNTQASYLAYLPPDYETAPSRRYPVLYWLHGGGGNQRSGAPMAQRIDAKIRAGEIPPFIVILVQGLPSVRYINTKDGTRPLEDVIIKDLIPHVDATYRTIASRGSRGIEGFSMGGWGSLHLGFSHPELLGVVSGIAPSIDELSTEGDMVKENFGYDQAFYDSIAPWSNVKDHADAIRGGTVIRLLVGGQDKLLGPVTKYHELLTSLKIEHQFAVAPGAPHSDQRVLDLLPFDGLAFWKTAFATAPSGRNQ